MKCSQDLQVSNLPLVRVNYFLVWVNYFSALADFVVVQEQVTTKFTVVVVQ